MLILTVIVFVLYNIIKLENEINENQYSHLVNDLSSVTNEFSTWMSKKTDMLDTTKDIVDNLSYDELVQWKTDNPYLNINNDNPDLSQVYVGLNDGGFITGGKWLPPASYDPRTRVWYQEAIEANATIISKVYTDLETGHQIVTISAPLYMEGQFAGVISADIFLNNIREYLLEEISGGQIYTYLMDREGTFIVHTSRQSLVGQNLYTDIQDELLIDYFEEVKMGTETVRMAYTFNEENIRGIVQGVGGGNWFLGVASKEKNSVFDIGLINQTNLMVNGLALSLMLFLIYRILKVKTELDSRNKFLTYENEKDFLTGIYNRRYFNLYLERIWELKDEAIGVSLMMIDIDKFKDYNDTYGHISGDEVLSLVTTCIGEQIRSGDVLARYGGEEFSLILIDVSEKTALKIGNKIKDAIYQRNFEHKVSPFQRITISIGVTTVISNSGISLTETIEHADSALYKAKASGRNKVVVYEES